MSDQATGGRHRPAAVSDAVRWLVTVSRRAGRRGPARRAERRARQRAGAFAAVATVMACQAGVFLAMALWADVSLTTRILLGASVLLGAGAVAFTVREVVLAYRRVARMGAQHGAETDVDRLPPTEPSP